MDNNPNMESFEKFIKQESDEFRMYPSKRVWYSVYNNFHPGRKWPSISMCIVLLSALLLIGFLNTKTNKIAIDNYSIALNNSNIFNGQSITQNQQPLLTNYTIDNTIINKSTLNTVASVNYPTSNYTNSKKQKTVSIKNYVTESATIHDKQSNNKESQLNLALTKSRKPAAFVSNQLTISRNNNVETAASLLNDVSMSNSANEVKTELDEQQGAEFQRIYSNHEIITALPIAATAGQIASTTIANGLSLNITNNLSKTSANNTDKSWIESYALYNRPAARKWKGKLAWKAHFTPSVVYRQLFNNAVGKTLSSNAFANTLNNSSINSTVNQTPSIGLETGVGLQYPIFKGVKLTAGVQLNYTRYTIRAFGNAHPTTTSITMNEGRDGQLYELYRSTPYSNTYGLKSVSLHNQTYQLSLPIGADIKLAGIDNLEWYAGATIQPTFIIAAKSYLISTDRRSYVNENSLLNHFNLNAGFETYISFKTAAGLTWQIGPQFRKQLFSTNSKQFSIEERLMSYGLKIGISKKL
jgi:hypothetical protein